MSAHLLVDDAATGELGAVIASVLETGDVVLLTGELGTGKTTLVKGLVRALGGSVQVTSPTFTLCHRYGARIPVAHVDCWRLQDLEEVVDLALGELLTDGVVVVEWGALAAPLFGSDALVVELAYPPDGTPGRLATLECRGPRWTARAAALRAVFGDACVSVFDGAAPRLRA